MCCWEFYAGAIAAAGTSAGAIAGRVFGTGMFMGALSVGGKALSDANRQEVSDTSEYMMIGAKAGFAGAITQAIFAPFTVFKALWATVGLIGQIPTTAQRIRSLVEAGVIGGTYCVTYDYIRSALDGKIPNAQEVFESYKNGALFGAYFHVGGEALSKASPFIKKAFNKAAGELSDNMKALKYAWDHVEMPKGVKLAMNVTDIDLKPAKDFVNKYKEALNDIKNGNDVLSNPEIELGKENLDALREKWNVPETNTIAVGKTDVAGLEDITFEGGSPKVRKEAGLPDLDIAMPDREIKAPSENPLFTRHAEEGVANEFDTAVSKLGIDPKDVTGTLYIHQSNPSGVCKKCIQGLANDTVKPGILKQLSLKYPNVTINITSEVNESVKVTGRSSFMIKNGKYVD